MARPQFTVQPQRSDGRGWIPCEPHRATSFAVVRTEEGKVRGKLYKVSRIIARCTTRTQAESLVEMNTLSYQPTPRHKVRKLGRRIINQ